MRLDPNNPLQLIPHTLVTNPNAVAVLPVFSPADPASSLILSAKTHLRPIPPELAQQMAQAESSARGGNGRGPTQPAIPTHIETGRMLLIVPSDLAKNFRGPIDERDLIYLFVVRRHVYDDVVRQAESGIVLPGMGTPSKIII